MAVIITDMDMPKRCFECKLKLSGTCAYLLKPTGGVNFKERLPNCPLKSTDEMIAEIKETYINNCDFNYQIAIDIIHKYCDKEQRRWE